MTVCLLVAASSWFSALHSCAGSPLVGFWSFFPHLPSLEHTVFTHHDSSSLGHTKAASSPLSITQNLSRVASWDGDYFWCRGYAMNIIETTTKNSEYYINLDDRVNLDDKVKFSVLWRKSSWKDESTMGPTQSWTGWQCTLEPVYVQCWSAVLAPCACPANIPPFSSFIILP